MQQLDVHRQIADLGLQAPDLSFTIIARSLFIASCPDSRNLARHVLSSCAATPSSRDNVSRSSPRSNRINASTLRRAENRHCRLGFPTGSPVALRAPSAPVPFLSFSLAASPSQGALTLSSYAVSTPSLGRRTAEDREITQYLVFSSRHAATEAGRLAALDRGYYRHLFENLIVLQP